MGGINTNNLVQAFISRLPHLLSSVSLLLLCTLLATKAVQAQQNSPVSLSAKAGLDGYCKDGQWLPVRASLENQGPEIQGQLQVGVPGIGNRPVTYAREVSLPPVSRKELFLYVYPEGYLSQITLRLVSGGKELAKVDLPLTCGSGRDHFYGLLTENLASLNQLADLDPPGGKALVAQLVPPDLPDRIQGLASLDTLVISGVDTSQLSPEQINALSGWVGTGGTLLVVGGPGWQKTIAGLASVAGILPFHPSGTRVMEGLDSAGNQAGNSEPLENLPGGLTVTTGQTAEGAEVVRSWAGLPSVIRKTYGQGEVIFLAFDPTLEPIRSWDGLTGFFRSILVQPAPSHGFLDWTQAGEAASVLAGLQIPSAGWLVAFLGVYVVVIGPANFWFLRRFKRRELAWVTIPLLVIVFSLLAFLVGRGLRGNRPVINRLAVVQTWPDIDQARVDGLLGVFSPARTDYALDIGPEFLAHTIPPSSIASQNSPLAFLQTETSGTAIPNFRTDIGEVRSLAVEGSLQAPATSSGLTLRVSRSGATLQGLLNLPPGLELEDAVLITPGISQGLGVLQAGKSREIGLGINQDASTGFTPGRYPGGPPTYANLPFNELLGSQDYFSDPQTRQRYLLLTAFFGQGEEPKPGLAPFILAGWSQESPLSSNLSGEVAVVHDTTLYLVHLDPQVEMDSGRIALPPGLFTWTVLEPGTYGSSLPYNSLVPTEGFSLRFQPAVPLPYKSVAGLNLRLKGYGAAGKSGVNISLWDFEAGRWVIFPDLDWGKTPVNSPELYVGPGGEVRMRLDSSSQISPVQIESADFILEVEG